MRVPFKEVPVGKLFRCNGNLCYKKSTRTAYLVFNNPKNPFGDLTEGSWFYFGQRDICQV
jgi:hypothetical protein